MTEYKGMHFKSRLEARWAIFFDSLNITYIYEPETFVFEDITITPSFYLPQHDRYVQVTDTVPDEDDENDKEMLLSLYVGKPVFILVGDVWLPGEPGSYEGWTYQPPILYTHPKDRSLGSDPTEEVVAPAMVKVILQKLEDFDLEAVVIRGNLALRSKELIYPQRLSESLEAYIDLLPQQQACIAYLAPLIVQHGEALIASMTPQEGWEIELLTNGLGWTTCAWVECTACRDIDFTFLLAERDMTHDQCLKPTKGTYKINTPALLKAYRDASTSTI